MNDVENEQKIEDIKNLIGTYEYTLFDIPVYIGNETYSMTPIKYTIPNGYILKQISYDDEQRDKINEMSKFIYSSNRRKGAYKKFVKQMYKQFREEKEANNAQV